MFSVPLGMLSGTGSYRPRPTVSLRETEAAARRRRGFARSGSEITLSSTFCLKVVILQLTPT